MRTFDAILAGYLLGAAVVGGVWAFVERDRGSTPLFLDLPRWDQRPAPVRARAVAVSGERAAGQPRSPTRATSRPAARMAPPAVRAHAPPRLELPGFPPGDDVARPEPRAAREVRASPAGTRVTVTAGAGFEAGLSSELASAPRLGFRVVVEPADHVGLELGYAATQSDELAMSTIELAARWYPQSRRSLRYYLLAGVGWRRFEEPLALDAAIVPLGAGLSYQRGHWRAETGLTLRLADRRRLHTLGAAAHVGWAF